MTVPAYLSYYVIAGAAAIIAALLFGLRRALKRADWNPRDRAIASRAAAIILTGWFALSVALALVDFYRASSARLPTIQYGILVPLLIGGAMVWRSAWAARIIDAVPQEWLIGVQLYRALGAIFLILYAAELLPGSFAWPAGLGDVLVGALAPVVAIAVRRGPADNADLAFWWNIFGLADLTAAVTMGFLTSPSPFELLAFDKPSELITAFPLVLVPVFLVPLSVLLHFASLAKLRRAALNRCEDRQTAPASV